MKTLTSVIAAAAMLVSTVAGAKNFKASEIYSTESFKYGRFEMSIQSSAGSAQLSTFFLYLNESETSKKLWREVDIEIFGKDTNAFQTNILTEKVEGTRLATAIVHKTKRNLHTALHTYALEWTPDSICWYVDDSLIRTEKDYALLCTEPMSIRMNHWAANISDWVGAFDKSAMPSFQYVDYISYSSYTKGQGPDGSDFTLAWKDDFNTIDGSRWLKADWTFDENYADFLPANVYTEEGKLVLKLHDATPAPVSVAELNEVQFSANPVPFNGSISLTIPEAAGQTIGVFSLSGKLLSEFIPADKSADASVSKILSESTEKSFILCLFRDGKVNGTIQVSKK